MRQTKFEFLLRETNGIVLILAACLWPATARAQPQDPRIGEWREDRIATSVGLYNVFEDLGNGMIRSHIAYNLAPENRLYLDYRCDGTLYPVRNYQGVATDFSESCTIVDDHRVTVKVVRNKEEAFKGPRLDEYWFDAEGTVTVSNDGNHCRSLMQQKAGDGRVLRTSERTYTRNAERCFSSDEQKFRECQRRTSPPGK